MKQQINEIRRMQQLAGILKENLTEMKDFSKWAVEDITQDEKDLMDKVIKAGEDRRKAKLAKEKAEKAKDKKEDVEEGIGKALGTAALGAALALGSPEKGMAQTRPSTTQNIKQISNKDLVDTVVTAYQKNPIAAKEWGKKFRRQHVMLNSIVDVIEKFVDRSQDIDSTSIEKFGIFLKSQPRTTQEFLDAMKPKF